MDKPIKVTTASFEKEVLKWPGTVLVDFWATWCPPCRMIAPILDSLSKEKSGQLKVAKVNVDEEPQLSARYNISSIPTLIIFQNGKIVQQASGAMPKAQLIKWVEPYISV